MPQVSLQRRSFRRAAGLLAGFALGSAPLRAQCPDGTPPPCGPPRAASAPHPYSVAVLYFDNLSPDPADAYLADGITEELIVRLQQVRRLVVKSRFESQRFRGRALTDPRAVGRALGAAYIVTGSVRKVGTRARLRVELVRAATGATVWSDAPEQTSADILSIESDIAAHVATAIAGSLLPVERSSLARRPTRSPEAYNLYLRSLHAAASWSEADPRSALAYLDGAIALDSTFAEAFAAKAVAWATLSDAFVLPREGFAMTRQAAEAALRLDSSLALAWAMLSVASSALDYDGPEALRLADRGASLDPRMNWPRLMRSVILWATGRRAEGLAESRRAWEADTLDAIGAGSYLNLLHLEGRADSMSAALGRMGGALPPEQLRVYEGLVHLARGDHEAAAQRVTWRFYGGFLAAEEMQALLALGRAAEARAVLDSLVAARRGSAYQNPLPLARAAMVLGDVEQALDWLELAYEERTQWLLLLDADPVLAPLRAQPRFLAVRQRMRL